MGKGRRESFRCLQLPPFPVVWKKGRAPGWPLLWLPEGLHSPAKRCSRSGPCSWCQEADVNGEETGLFLHRARTPEAVPSRREPPREEVGAQEAGSVCVPVLSFVIVRRIFRSKQKNAQAFTPIHLRTRNRATAAWGEEDNCLTRTPQPRVGGTGTRVGTKARAPANNSSQSTTKMSLTIVPSPNLELYLCRLVDQFFFLFSFFIVVQAQLSLLSPWMELDSLMLSEIRQAVKDK